MAAEPELATEETSEETETECEPVTDVTPARCVRCRCEFMIPVAGSDGWKVLRGNCSLHQNGSFRNAVGAPYCQSCGPTVRYCYHCGCTDEVACAGGCWWTGRNCCSRCFRGGEYS